MLQPFSTTRGFACTGAHLSAQEMAVRERLLTVLDWFFEARAEAGLDSFAAELFWPYAAQTQGLPHGVSGTRDAEPSPAADGAARAERPGAARTCRGPMHWRYVCDEARLAATARLWGKTPQPVQGFTEDDLVFLLLMDEALSCSETVETDSGLAYVVRLDEQALRFFGDAAPLLLARFSALSLVLERDGKTLFSGQPLLTRVTKEGSALVLDVNPLALAAVGLPSHEVLADWAALGRRKGARPLAGALTLMAVLFSSLYDWDEEDGGQDDQPELAEEEIAIMLGVEPGSQTDILAALYEEISSLPGWSVRRFTEIARDACFGEGESIVRIERSRDAGWDDEDADIRV